MGFLLRKRPHRPNVAPRAVSYANARSPDDWASGRILCKSPFRSDTEIFYFPLPNLSKRSIACAISCASKIFSAEVQLFLPSSCRPLFGFFARSVSFYAFLYSYLPIKMRKRSCRWTAYLFRIYFSYTIHFFFIQKTASGDSSPCLFTLIVSPARSPLKAGAPAFKGRRARRILPYLRRRSCSVSFSM